VNLQLFTDDPKALTIFLLNKRYRFEEGTRRMQRGGRFEEVPQIELEVEGVPVNLTVLDLTDERVPPRVHGEHDASQRARLADVEALLRQSP